MYAATGDRKYIAYLDEEWAKTSDLLYDKQEHLYARDADYLTKTEANGKKMFWGRGNGWVMGGIARTLDYLPKDDPARVKYVTQLKEMAARVAALQGADGLWRAGLLDHIVLVGNEHIPAGLIAADYPFRHQKSVGLFGAGDAYSYEVPWKEGAIFIGQQSAHQQCTRRCRDARRSDSRRSPPRRPS